MVRWLPGHGSIRNLLRWPPDDSATTRQIRTSPRRSRPRRSFLDGTDAATTAAPRSRPAELHARARLGGHGAGLSRTSASWRCRNTPEQAEPYVAIHRLLGADPAPRRLRCGPGSVTRRRWVQRPAGLRLTDGGLNWHRRRSGSGRQSERRLGSVRAVDAQPDAVRTGIQGARGHRPQAVAFDQRARTRQRHA